MKHSGTKGLGENIYWASAITYSNKKNPNLKKLLQPMLLTHGVAKSELYV